MATVELTTDNFDQVTNTGMVLVDFWAAWCGPCQWYAPVFERAAQRHGDIVFAKVDLHLDQCTPWHQSAYVRPERKPHGSPHGVEPGRWGVIPTKR